MTNIHRLPTKTETIIGGFFALLLSSVLGYVFWHVFRAASGRPEILTPSAITVLAVFALVFAWSSSLFLRILFGSPEIPSFRGQTLMGWFLIICGLAFFCGSLLVSNSSTVFRVSQGVIAMSLGIFWIAQARKGSRTRV